jgi:predicted HTH domain antitoxin
MGYDFFKPLEDAIFDTIFGVLNALISAATGGVVTDFLSGEITLENKVDELLTGMRDRTIELVEDAGVAITDATTDLTNAIAKNFADVLGITALQQRIAENFEREMEARIGVYEAEAELVESAEEAAARELAARTMTVLSDRATFYQDQYSVWMGRCAEMEAESEELQFETSMAGLEMASHMLEIDVTMIHDLAEERNVAAVIGMSEEIAQSLMTADEWARDVAIKPLAYGDMAMQVLAEFLERTPEEIQEELKAYIEASYKVTGDLIPEFTPAPGGK